MTKKTSPSRDQLRITWSDRNVLWCRAVQAANLTPRARFSAFLVGLVSSRHSGKFYVEQVTEKALSMGSKFTADGLTKELDALVASGHLRKLGKGSVYVLHLADWDTGKDPVFYEAVVGRLLADVIEGYERAFELRNKFVAAVSDEDEIEAAGLALKILESYERDLAPAKAAYVKYANLLLGGTGVVEQ